MFDGTIPTLTEYGFGKAKLTMLRVPAFRTFARSGLVLVLTLQLQLKLRVEW